MRSSTCNDTITTFTNNINDEYVTLFCFIFKMASRFGGSLLHVRQHLKNHIISFTAQKCFLLRALPVIVDFVVVYFLLLQLLF